MPPQVTPYNWVQFSTVRQYLALRLNDPTNQHWSDSECGVYIVEALRVFNCLTQQWVQDWTATYDDTAATWQSLANGLNSLVGNNQSSPRTQTLTDANLYAICELHLLEPPTGAVWTGTPQFQIADLSQALQRRRDAVLQASACNVGPFASNFSLPPGQSRVYLPDSTTQSILDIRRVRFIPAANQGVPSTLYREDGLAYEYFEPDFPQTTTTPFAYDVISGPPLALTFDSLGNVPNTLDILAIISGGFINPPTASPLLIPDDWSWVLKWGMLADVLSKESESQDLQRAKYCEQRFQEGLKLMIEMPWILQARINDVACDTPSVQEMDDFAYGWQEDPNALPAIVRGGIDVFAVSPPIQPGENVSVSLTLMANAPVPVLDTDPVQVSRDVLNAILDYSEHLAQWKHGGKEFTDSIPLYHNFLRTAMMQNSRLRMSGIFATTLRPPDTRQAELDPRFSVEAQ